jgi:hypothetical protein
VSDEAAQVVINEIMGNNKSTIKDACNNYSDWVELKNIGSTPVDLTGFSLTDGSNVPWEFPASTVLQPGAYLLVWASNETLCSRNNFQANFNISKEGQELIRLADAQGRTVDFRLTAPFMPDRSQGRNPDGTGVWSLLDSPTPATVNSGGTTANQPPYISAIPPKELKVGQSLAVAIEAIDTDGDALLYIVSSSGSFSHFSLSGNMINFAPQAGDEGAYNITVIVDDRHGHQSRISFSLTVKPQQAGPVLINEVMGNEDDNSSVSKDIDGDANDWIELINTSNEAIDVSGYSLTDGSMPSPPGPRKFPNPTVIPAHGYLLVWASNKRRVDGELRANFKIDANGETLILANANGQAIHTIITGSFNLNKTKGLNPNGEDGTWQELAQPTPGSSNNPSGMARTFVKRQPPRALPSTIKQKKTTLKNKRVAGNFQGYAEK